MTITLQALSLVEKVEPVQVCFTLRLRDQWCMWMHEDGYKVYMNFYRASNGSWFMVNWTIFKNRLLEVGLTQNRETHGIPNAHNRCFVLFYHAWGSTWIKIHWNSIWLRTRTKGGSTLGSGIKETPKSNYSIGWEKNLGLKEFTVGYKSKVWRKEGHGADVASLFRQIMLEWTQ